MLGRPRPARRSPALRSRGNVNRAMTAVIPEVLKPLAALSARLGLEPELVPAAGAYASLKHDGTLWVNGYGSWLANASSEPVFLPMDLAATKAAAGLDRAEIEDAFQAARRNNDRLMPAPETALHALLPHRVVLQVPGVNTLVHTMLADGRERLDARLAGLAFAVVPYSWWGEDLTVLARVALANRPVDIVILERRGLAVGGGSETAAEALLREVEARLALPMRPLVSPDHRRLEVLAGASDLTLPRSPDVHACALDDQALALAARGSPHHEQAVWLGREPPPAVAEARLAAWIDARRRRGGEEPAYILVPGLGVLARRDLREEAHEALRQLSLVLLRVPHGASVADPAWPTPAALSRRADEKYRRWVAQGSPR